MRPAAPATTDARRPRPSRVAAQPEPEAAVRRGTWASVLITAGSWGVGWLPMTPDSVFSGTTLLNPLRVYLPGVLLLSLIHI